MISRSPKKSLEKVVRLCFEDYKNKIYKRDTNQRCEL